MEITNHKGFQIDLDTTSGKFSAERTIGYRGMNNFPTLESTSLKTIKQKINNFIKENSQFGSFKIIRTPDSGHNLRYSLDIVDVVGLSANNRLMIRKGDEKSSSLSGYDVGSYVLYNEANQRVIADVIAKLKVAYDKYHAEEAEINTPLAKLKTMPLVDFLKKENIEVK